MADMEVSVGRGRLSSCPNEEEEEEEEEVESCGRHRDSPPATLSPWTRADGSRAAFGRLKAKLFETRLAAQVRQAQLALTDSLKHAGWAVEHKVSEVSRRGWSEATRAWGSGGSGGGTLALTGGSGGPHERSSLLLGPGDGYQRLDNNSGVQANPDNHLDPQNSCLEDKEGDSDMWSENRSRDKDRSVESNDGWGDDNWTSDWGSSNNSKASSPTQTTMDSPEPSPNARISKKNANNNSKKNKGSTKKEGKAEQELLVDVGNSGTKGHTWDNWDDDWEKVDGQ